MTQDSIARILLIDDDEVDRASVRRSLAARQARVQLTECATAADALAKIAEQRFSCVLIDYLLAGTTALELLPKLMPQLDGAPVIVLTGHGDEQLAVDLMKAGAVDYIAKDRLDGRMLERAITQAVSLGSAKRRVDRAERAQRVYLARLRGLVERTPALYGDRTLLGRMRVACATAQSLFGAEQAFIGVRGVTDEDLLIATHGDTVDELVPEDAQWREVFDGASKGAHDARVDVRSWSREHADDVKLHTYPLLSSERAWLGVIGMRLVEPPSAFAELNESLFAQLGEMVAVAVENANLYDATSRAVSARDAVMAVVSHDLRSPLSSFTLGLDIVREADEEEKHKFVLDRMQRASTHMNRLIDDLLDVSRIERRELHVVPVKMSVRAVLEELQSIHSPIADAGGVALKIATGVDLDVKADRHRLIQVLANLVSNALKFAPKGSSVAIKAEPRDGEVVFSVADEGPGIGPDQLPRVFERFYRQGGKGLGLGLYIARAIVDAHGGRIWVESEPGRGAHFQFTLKAAS